MKRNVAIWGGTGFVTGVGIGLANAKSMHPIFTPMAGGILGGIGSLFGVIISAPKKYHKVTSEESLDSLRQRAMIHVLETSNAEQKIIIINNKK